MAQTIYAEAKHFHITVNRNGPTEFPKQLGILDKEFEFHYAEKRNQEAYDAAGYYEAEDGTKLIVCTGLL